MGQLVEGVWESDKATSRAKGNGSFQRPAAIFRNWITPDGEPGPSGEGGFTAEAGRYHLYVSYACPWAHRTLIFRKLKGLEDEISVSVVHPDMLTDGWTFDNYPGATGDQLYGLPKLRDIYTKAQSDVTCRVTVPVLWDRDKEVIVSNESSEIIRMLNSAFDHLTGNDMDFWPENMRDDIEEVNTRIYETLNNGVYRSGFATSQAAYDDAVIKLFATLDWLEDRLSSSRYLMGDRITEADWRLVPTLFRFDCVYHLHFKCNHRRLIDYSNLWAYARELYQWPGVKETVNFDHMVRHYHYSHESINPHRIIPINPLLDWDLSHGREGISAG